MSEQKTVTLNYGLTEIVVQFYRTFWKAWLAMYVTLLIFNYEETIKTWGYLPIFQAIILFSLAYYVHYVMLLKLDREEKYVDWKQIRVKYNTIPHHVFASLLFLRFLIFLVQFIFFGIVFDHTKPIAELTYSTYYASTLLMIVPIGYCIHAYTQIRHQQNKPWYERKENQIPPEEHERLHERQKQRRKAERLPRSTS